MGHGVSKTKPRRSLADIVIEAQSEETTKQSAPLPDNEEGENIQAIIDKCWEKIEEQCARYVKPTYSESPVICRRVVRLFVSSTFRDYHSEREVLVKKVIPELREWCESYQLDLIECDLRWGVPKESTTHATICTCLGELDRCHLETDGEPFFLNMLSERFGWAPKDTDVPVDIQETYYWVHGSSITLMEILHAAYRSRNPNAVFFVRDPGYVKHLPAHFLQDFTEKDVLPRLHLKTLKHKLAVRFPDQVFHYTCSVAGTEDKSTGQEKVNLCGLEDFAERVLEFFKGAILRKYPNRQNVKELSPADQEQELQRLFVVKHAEFLCGREDELSGLLEFALTNDMCSLLTDHHQQNGVGKFSNEVMSEWKMTVDDGPAIYLRAPPGHGKTVLLATVTTELQKKDVHVFYHFVGNSSLSTATRCLLQRLLSDLAPSILEGRDFENQILSNETIKEMMVGCLELCRHKSERIVLIFDGLNELQEHSSTSFLSFMPPAFPRNVRCIVSSISGDPIVESRLEQCVPLDLTPLNEESRQKLAEHYLGCYNKRLDEEQMALLSSHGGSEVPLWMSVACEELRVFGEFSMVTSKISELPETLGGLVGNIFTRLIKEDETECLKQFLCILATMLYGVRVSDVQGLLGEPGEAATLMQWATVRRQLKPFLRFVGGSTEQAFFIHKAVRQATVDLLLTEAQERRRWSSHVANHLFTIHRLTKDITLSEEIAHQLFQANQRSRLLEFIQGKHYHLRYVYTEKLRCTFRSQPANMQKLQLCTFCVNQRNPRGGSMPYSWCCILCGNAAPDGTSQPAHFCHRHKILPMPGFETCCACKKRHPTNLMKMAAKLCMSCSAGGPMMPRCCAFQL